jgi:hypothetical protein
VAPGSIPSVAGFFEWFRTRKREPSDLAVVLAVRRSAGEVAKSGDLRAKIQPL